MTSLLSSQKWHPRDGILYDSWFSLTENWHNPDYSDHTYPPKLVKVVAQIDGSTVPCEFKVEKVSFVGKRIIHLTLTRDVVLKTKYFSAKQLPTKDHSTSGMVLLIPFGNCQFAKGETNERSLSPEDKKLISTRYEVPVKLAWDDLGENSSGYGRKWRLIYYELTVTNLPVEDVQRLRAWIANGEGIVFRETSGVAPQGR